VCPSKRADARQSRVEQELGLTLLNGYGITECSPGISCVRGEAREVQAVGSLLPGLEARIVGRDGEIVAAGEVGELHVRGAKMRVPLPRRAVIIRLRRR
jgi:long-chain acyl-CoA synthetase